MPETILGSAAATGEVEPVLTRIDHVGIACRDLESKIAFYESTMGLTVVSREVNEAQGVREAMLQVAAGPAGGSYVQLLEPLGPDTPVGRFLERRGEGVHHVGYGVADITAALASIGASGVRLIDARPRHGSMGASIAFLHPADLGGVLTELVQAASAGPTQPGPPAPH
jgi:methylmalonyl-CoA/ethylmalonyl-CoA epimerase